VDRLRSDLVLRRSEQLFEEQRGKSFQGYFAISCLELNFNTEHCSASQTQI